MLDIKAGKRLFFRNRFNGNVEWLVVKEVYERGFSFLHNGCLHRVSYQYAEGKLFDNSSELYTCTHKPLPEPALNSEKDAVSDDSPCEEIGLSTSDAISIKKSIPESEPSPSCDSCQLRRNGRCSELRGVLCSDYLAVPYISKEERDSWPEYGAALSLRFRGKT